ncbi:methyltransferase domain-containing protein [Solibacillus sp. FSL R7-0682]|uniref:class I SAM-dependent methyltransferase n=1 Tax=Solibacillus sp. FSL R7-0682 TaxID=2921690 RepID=UPI0030F601BB
MVAISNSNYNYLNFLAKFGIGGAHPGGIELSKKVFQKESIKRSTQILDVGCGTGQSAAYLALTYGANVTGIDNNTIMVEKAKERMASGPLSVKIIEGSIENTSLLDDQFDLIISESVLSFVNKPRALKEISRLLKSGGRLIAIEHTLNEHTINKEEENEIKQFFGFDALLKENDWISLLQQAGFHNIEVEKGIVVDSEADYHFSKDIDLEYYSTMEKLAEINENYEEILSYRIYLCTK